MTAVRSSDALITDLGIEKTKLFNLSEKYRAQRDEANARASEWNPDQTILYLLIGIIGVGVGVGFDRLVLR